MRQAFYFFVTLLFFVMFSCNSEPIPKEEKVKTQETIKIEREVCGEGDIALLFVHGWCIDKSYWSEQIAYFCPEFKVVSIDLPGFGSSGKNRSSWSIELYADDVLKVIEELGLEKVVLVGHSMAGDIILEAALESDKVIALVGVDNFKNVGLEFNEETDRQIDAFLEQMSQNFPEVAIQYAQTGLFHVKTPSSVKDRVEKSISNTDPIVAVETLKALFDYVPKEVERLSLLEQDLYLINSDGSPTLITGLDSLGVNYRKFDISMTGHYPMCEKPDDFNLILEDIMDRIAAFEEL